MKTRVKHNEEYICFFCKNTYKGTEDPEEHFGSEDLSDEEIFILCDDCWEENKHKFGSEKR